MHSSLCFAFLCCVEFFSACFGQVLFHLGDKKKWLLVALDRWSAYTVANILELARVDSALVILGEWSSYRGGRLDRFDYNALR